MAKFTQHRGLIWLVVGLAAGIGISNLIPRETVFAAATDRNDKFAMATCDLNVGIEGIFILDFLTGTLRGGALNSRTGKFQYAYERNIAEDFDVDPQAEPYYSIVTGRVGLPSSGRNTPALGVVYVAELTSGRVVAYTFPYRESSRGTGLAPLTPLDTMQFRESVE